jgi:hypothetical protein
MSGTRAIEDAMVPQRNEQRRPLLPQALLLMSIPLYLGYPIKHELIPAGIIFALVYSWAVLSFVLVPVLCLAEVVFLLRGWLRRSPEDTQSPGWHVVGLAGGVGAMLAAFAVR